ncbi:Zinc finger SWIM domain-containing protein 8 [Trichinella zimbabwensis]|uniref:Zinc finger SWIM domain-containing protein 8 n=1 Tax=Trichinella zimbabwensis TaxID=268475 RepID=A0A0V1I4L3_9BILA|nr:Zinc finger SWIM domain-containing protein 8 [Trichinella zimbabwensis]
MLEPGADLDIFDEYDQEDASWQDSERFEDDSLCSWSTRPPSSCYNYRSWSGRLFTDEFSVEESRTLFPNLRISGEKMSNVLSLVELSAKAVAKHIPFEMVENFKPPVPEQLQQRIAFWSFPENSSDIRTYACLSNGRYDEFAKGISLYDMNCIRSPMQIGFHLSAVVDMNLAYRNGYATVPDVRSYNVSVTFDRQKVIFCSCTCSPKSPWCCHVIAVCLYRIYKSTLVPLRPPISESLSRLKRVQLQKFSQHLITYLPKEVLSLAQSILDELLDQNAAINAHSGAPDPTAGAAVADRGEWYFEDRPLRFNIDKILNKFCEPAPTIISDVSHLSVNTPPVSCEYQALLRPLRCHDPEGLWNLIFIVHGMFARKDRNAISLLDLITDVCMKNMYVACSWFLTNVAHSLNGSYNVVHSFYQLSSNTSNSRLSCSTSCQQFSTRYGCASLMDELVRTWEMAVLNMALTSRQRLALADKLYNYHFSIVERISTIFERYEPRMPPVFVDVMHVPATLSMSMPGMVPFIAQNFTGFKKAIQLCYLDWTDWSIPGLEMKDNMIAEQRRLRGHTLLARYYQSMESFANWKEQSKTKHSQKGSCSRHYSILFTGSSSGHAGNNQESLHSQVESEPRPLRSPMLENVLQEYAQLCEIANFYHECTGRWDNEEGAVNLTVRLQKHSIKDTLGFVSEDLAKLDVPQDREWIRFVRCRALHAYGYHAMAKVLASHLALSMIASPPDLMKPTPPPISLARSAAGVTASSSAGTSSSSSNTTATGVVSTTSSSRKKKKIPEIVMLIDPKAIEVTDMALDTFSRGLFLLEVFARDASLRELAFSLGMFLLELSRPCAVSKVLEVRLSALEAEVLSRMKQLPIGVSEMQAVRSKAEKLVRRVVTQPRCCDVLPVSLAVYIAHTLLLNSETALLRIHGDEPLGLAMAVVVLMMKSTASEVQHPLLFESLRRKRGDFLLSLLSHYKTNTDVLSIMLNALLENNYCEIRYQTDRFGVVEAVRGCTMSDPPSAIISQVRVLLYGQENDQPSSSAESGSKTSAESSSKGASGGRRTFENFKSPVDALAAKVRNVVNLRTDARRGAGGWMQTDENLFDQGIPFLTEEPMQRYSCNYFDTTGSYYQNMRYNLANTIGTVQTLNYDIGGDMAFALNTDPNVVIDAALSGPTPSDSTQKIQDPDLPSEAHVHFMMELAKRILTEAGGTHSSAIFITPTTTVQALPNVVCRPLQLFAFQVGLHAIGLHNKISPNWYTRTYSSCVSWISSQVTEIGPPAIDYLFNSWQNHLTASEVASIADKASQTHDQNMVNLAALLALEALNYAHRLSPAEIQRALSQCREQGQNMLERACLVIEQVAAVSDIYPDVVFQVAQIWYEMYTKALDREKANSSAEEAAHADVSGPTSSSMQESQQRSPAVFNSTGPSSSSSTSSPAGAVEAVGQMAMPSTAGGALSSHGHPYGMLDAQQTQMLMYYGTAFAAADSVFQQPFPILTPQGNPVLPPLIRIAPPPPGSVQVGLHTGYNVFRDVPLLPNSAFQQAPTGAQALFHQPQPPTICWHDVSNMCVNPRLRLTTPGPTIGAGSLIRPAMSAYFGPTGQVASPTILSLGIPDPTINLVVAATDANASGGTVERENNSPLFYLHAAYRVGMLAMKTMERRNAEDRTYVKFSQNPPYGDDVKWLLQVCKELGLEYVQSFCSAACRYVVSPFIFYELTADVGSFLTNKNASSASSQYLPLVYSDPYFYNLVSCSVTSFYRVALQKISLPRILANDVEDLCVLVRTARTAFSYLPDGESQFHNFMQTLRKQQKCKKDIWYQIINAIK